MPRQAPGGVVAPTMVTALTLTRTKEGRVSRGQESCPLRQPRSAVQWISGSGTGSVPRRKSKSQPWSACITWRAYSAPNPRGYATSRGFHPARRRAAWKPPTPAFRRGYGSLYVRHVLQADQGCDFDFLLPEA